VHKNYVSFNPIHFAECEQSFAVVPADVPLFQLPEPSGGFFMSCWLNVPNQMTGVIRHFVLFVPLLYFATFRN
jgi:hypothetical protein